jgi:hypothetical protein
MTRAQIMKWIERMETANETDAMNDWTFGNVIGGPTLSFQYAENTRTGERSFDTGFITQVAEQARRRIISTGQMDEFQVIIGPDPEGQSESLFRDAEAAGVIPPRQIGSVLPISNDNELKDNE